MRVKRYVVDSMPDALQQIRTDLGKDAVILNTKEIRSGGFLGFFSKKKIEVIAATDNSAAAAPAANSAASQISKNIAAVQRQVAAMAPAVTSPSTPAGVNPYAAAMKKPPAPVAIIDESKDSTQAKLSLFSEQPSPPPKAPPVQQEQRSFAAPVHNEHVLLEEIKQMKEMMVKLSQQRMPANLPPVLQMLEEKLLHQEVDPQIVDQIIHSIQIEAEQQGAAEITESFAMASVRRQLNELIRTGGSKNIAADTQIAHFVGPTGVGKTTTIAKLAAEQVLKYHRKVGFITSDTYRIAAVEQLKTYGTILNVPLEVVFSPQDLTRAFKQLEDRDIIFMDTAGRNFRNEMYVSELNALLQSKGKSETFLVLSLTTKYKDMRAITNNFTRFKLDKVLFTKMDETDTYGALVNLVKEFGLQLSYVTNGQGVPDDIIEVNEQHIIDLILEERIHE
ncbi:flagellar biosynthesis protein FlhF [Paenibacillus thalictri]|uniref:Flagellar biosynthesis protein FlhF n=1 Tax=Paenibacillus thalictri TaxID=2527873 RepID=A0A4Q9DSA1_9BACL|nr:flagellar biosynthesis protein FlhF [Paenibacillus thalictri]TBL77745.1 flagellar biosynthesis protein FlhF [Paenibacillus thalictri]